MSRRNDELIQELRDARKAQSGARETMNDARVIYEKTKAEYRTRGKLIEEILEEISTGKSRYPMLDAARANGHADGDSDTAALDRRLAELDAAADVVPAPERAPEPAERKDLCSSLHDWRESPVTKIVPSKPLRDRLIEAYGIKTLGDLDEHIPEEGSLDDLPKLAMVQRMALMECLIRWRLARGWAHDEGFPGHKVRVPSSLLPDMMPAMPPIPAVAGAKSRSRRKAGVT